MLQLLPIELFTLVICFLENIDDIQSLFLINKTILGKLKSIILSDTKSLSNLLDEYRFHYYIGHDPHFTQSDGKPFTKSLNEYRFRYYIGNDPHFSTKSDGNPYEIKSKLIVRIKGDSIHGGALHEDSLQFINIDYKFQKNVIDICIPPSEEIQWKIPYKPLYKEIDCRLYDLDRFYVLVIQSKDTNLGKRSLLEFVRLHKTGELFSKIRFDQGVFVFFPNYIGLWNDGYHSMIALFYSDVVITSKCSFTPNGYRFWFSQPPEHIEYLHFSKDMIIFREHKSKILNIFDGRKLVAAKSTSLPFNRFLVYLSNKLVIFSFNKGNLIEQTMVVGNVYSIKPHKMGFIVRPSFKNTSTIVYTFANK